MKQLFFVLVLISVFIVGCVTEPKIDPNTPEGLYKLAEFYRKQDRFEEAITQYKTVTNKHPYSKLAIESELKVADCHYEKEEFAESFASYKSFKELHPRHPSIDYAVYRAAESLREQLPSTVDRDLAQATTAISLYEELSVTYPQSKYAKESAEKKLKLIQMLADKEIYIADFYFQQDKYISALTRYEMFLTTFPQNQKTPYVLLQAARAARKADVPDKIKLHAGRLMSEFPATKEAKRAREDFPNVR
jgi:outer membrane protein assembly factor BamD